MRSKDKWLRSRKAGIGGSDIAAILGLSPWRTAVDVWRDKLGDAEPQQDERAREAMDWGLALEGVIADHFSRLHGVQLHRVHGIVRHPQHPWAIGTPDRVVAAPGLRPRLRRGQLSGADSLLEIKTASAYSLREWEHDGLVTVPVYYVAQCMWYLAVTGLETCHIAALIGGQRYIESRIDRDEETIAEMLRIAGEWWQKHIVEGVQPEPATARDVQILAPRDSGRSIEASTALADIIWIAADARAAKLEAEQQYQALAEQIQLEMGDASEITLEGRRMVSWRVSADRRVVDWEAVARDLAGGAVPADIIERHTSVRPGARRFMLHVESSAKAIDQKQTEMIEERRDNE